MTEYQYLMFLKINGALYQKLSTEENKGDKFEDGSFFGFLIKEEEGEFVVDGLPYLMDNDYRLNLNTLKIEDFTNEVITQELTILKKGVLGNLASISKIVSNYPVAIILNDVTFNATNINDILNIISSKEGLNTNVISMITNNEVVSVDNIQKSTLLELKQKLYTIIEEINKVKATFISSILQAKIENDLTTINITEENFNNEFISNRMISLTFKLDGIEYTNLKDGSKITDIEELKKLVELKI